LEACRQQQGKTGTGREEYSQGEGSRYGCRETKAGRLAER
jgi:hypothetical protein